MAWGDKGEEYRPDRCQHGPDDGCEWCCEKCNKDQHWCPSCGTVSNHHETVCNPSGCPTNETEEHTAVNGHKMIYRVVIRNGDRVTSQWDAEHSDNCGCLDELVPEW